MREKKRGRKKVEKIQVGGKNGERNGIKRLRTRAIRWKKNEQNSVQEAERVSSSAKKYAKRQGRKKRSRGRRSHYIYSEKLWRPWIGPVLTLMGPPIMTIASSGYIKLNKKHGGK